MGNENEERFMELVQGLEAIAPPVDRDHKGITIDESRLLFSSISVDTDSIAVCVFPTMEVVKRMEEEGIRFLISHYNPSHETQTHMLHNGMNGYVAHLSQDVASEGNIYHLASSLGLHDIGRFTLYYNGRKIENGIVIASMPPISNVPEDHGRMLEERVMAFARKTDSVAGKFPGESLEFYYFGDEVGKDSRIAIVPGDSIRQSFLDQAKKHGAGLFIGGRSNAHAMVRAQEIGMSLYEIGHYRSEVPGMVALAEKLRGMRGNEDSNVVFIPNTKAQIYRPLYQPPANGGW